MAGRFRTSRLVMAVACGALFVAAPVVAAAPASACPTGHFADPYTGQCYASGQIGTVGGIPCIPGKSLGTCLGILQNQPIPGSGAAPPYGPWP